MSEAKKELRRLLHSVDQGAHVDPSRATVGEFLERWLADWAAVNVSPKTGERYGELIRKHTIPFIGNLPVQKLRPVHLSGLYAKLQRESGLAARTVGHVHRVCHRAFGHARQWGVLPSNPAEQVKAPKVESVEIEILKPDQVQKVLEAVRGRFLYPIITTALATGMRRGELLALRWQDVDMERATVRVERSLEQTRSGLRFKSPKTKHGRRKITLPSFAVSELRSHWKAQQEQRLALGLGKAAPESLVFARFDGEPRHPDSFSKEWSEVARRLGLKHSFHSLRHSHASQLIASGLDVLTISRRLGHSSPAITLGVYGHMFSNTDDQAARALDVAFSGRT
jgi:integrase